MCDGGVQRNARSAGIDAIRDGPDPTPGDKAEHVHVAIGEMPPGFGAPSPGAVPDDVGAPCSSHNTQATPWCDSGPCENAALPVSHGSPSETMSIAAGTACEIEQRPSAAETADQTDKTSKAGAQAAGIDTDVEAHVETLEPARSSKEKHVVQTGQPSGGQVTRHFESEDPAITQLWVDCKSLRQEMAELLEIVQRTCKRCRVSAVGLTPPDLTPRSRGMSHRSELRKLVEALCLAHESTVAAAEVAEVRRTRSPECRRRQSSAPARACRSQHPGPRHSSEREVQEMAEEIEFLQRKLQASEAREAELRAESSRQEPRSRSEGAPERAPEPEPKADVSADCATHSTSGANTCLLQCSLWLTMHSHYTECCGDTGRCGTKSRIPKLRRARQAWWQTPVYMLRLCGSHSQQFALEHEK